MAATDRSSSPINLNSNSNIYSNTLGSSGYIRPLLNYVQNEWQNKAHHIHTIQSTKNPNPSPWLQTMLSLITAPRLRRFLIVSGVLVIACWAGWKFVMSESGKREEDAALKASLDKKKEELFGTNALPKLEDLVLLRDLEERFLPGADIEVKADQSRRLVFIGDVHGCRQELEKLLQKLSFNPDNDHLVFAGDIINKGPDSPGVVDLARKHGASCVRGNHEDKVLSLRHEMVTSNTLTVVSEDDSRERKLARELTDEQVKWLDACPVILRVGQIPGMGEVVVVHGGLVPGVELEKQDPYSVMNMLTIDLETHVPSDKREGTNWTKLFNKYQTELYKTLKKTSDAKTKTKTVIYGHDSKRSLSIDKYTKGLDTGCVKGEKLTALVVEAGGKQSIVQVNCDEPKPKKQEK